MKVQTITLMLLSALACSKADTPVEAPTIAQEPAYEDYADDWIAFADATANLALDERKQAFRRDVEAKFPAFYTSRLVGDGDARLTRWVDIGWTTPWISQRIVECYRELIGMAPVSKLMIGSGGHGSPEISWLAAKTAKIALGEVLSDSVRLGLMTQRDA